MLRRKASDMEPPPLWDRLTEALTLAKKYRVDPTRDMLAIEQRIRAINNMVARSTA